MTYEQYWYGDCLMVRAYVQAEKIRQENKNTELWLNGLYVYDAIQRLSPILRPFTKRGTKALPYPKEPYGNEEKRQKEEISEEQKAENERLKAVLYFKNWARMAEKHFKEE